MGHWGTLDPAACGVLVLAIGKAGRLLPYLACDDKVYVFELQVGARTDTGDATGTIVERMPVPPHWSDALPAVAASLMGQLEQTPPMHSAVKIAGRPLYKLARRGAVVERQPRTVTIFALRVLACFDRGARLLVHCSSGTYIRTLCEQIGTRLGVAAHMGMLLRTKSGPFSLRDAVTPATLARDAAAGIIDPLSVLPMPAISLSDGAAARVLHGNPADCADLVSAAHTGDRVALVHGGRLIAVGVVSDGERCTIAPLRVFAGFNQA